MLGYRLFSHALRMLLGNFGATIRIGAPLIVASAALAWANAKIEDHASSIMMQNGSARALFESLPIGISVGYPLLFFFAIIAGLWTAVSWHRFTLLEELPGPLFPAWRGRSVWAYFVTGLVMVLVMFLASLAIGFIGGLVLGLLKYVGVPRLVRAIGFSALVTLLIMVISYRISPILPAAAIGKKIGVGDAWRATSGANGALIMLAVSTTVAMFAAVIPIPALGGIAPLLGLVWAAMINWFLWLLGISILTTLYGYFVEKRDLNV